MDSVSSVKDIIKNKISEHPKTAIASSTAAALGAGYGAYKYLKNKKLNNKQTKEIKK